MPYYSKNEKYGVNRGNALFYPTEKLVGFYEQYLFTQFVNVEELQKKCSQNDHKILNIFLKKLGVKDKDPEMKDEVFNIILPQYEVNGKPINNTVEEGVKHLKILLQFYSECPQNLVDDYVIKLKTIQFLLYKTAEDPEEKYWGKAENLYYPTEDLLFYFETKPDTNFVDIEDYQEYIEEKDRQILKEFLLKIGVSELPRILDREITDWYEKNNIKAKSGENLKSGTYGYTEQGAFDKFMDGCSEILDNINKEKSDNLWTILNSLSRKYQNFNQELTGKHKYFYYFQQYQYFESTTLTRLKTTKWLISTTNEFVVPYEITINELAERYVRNRELEELLEFKSGITLEKEKEIFVKNLSNEEYLEFKN